MTEYYKDKLEKGLEYQDWISDILRTKLGLFVGVYASKKYQAEKGESQAGIEIKHDMLMNSTGNAYIEVAEKSNAANENWVPSGIFREDNSWLYVIGDYDNIYIFSKQQLRNIVSNEAKRIQHRMTYKEIKQGTSKGYTYPLEVALSCGSCLRHIKINEGENNNA